MKENLNSTYHVGDNTLIKLSPHLNDKDNYPPFVSLSVGRGLTILVDKQYLGSFGEELLGVGEALIAWAKEE